ncbi:zinc ribbon domain-containing protein [Candidatus Woesearchaeota archaeon]|nr:zinc ribbon domain-containing protein [Candidatus Woesearchaeota archaeon]
MSVKYRCANCNYEFSMGSDRTLSCCPYCGKAKTLRSVGRGAGFADKLVRNS